VSGQPAYKRSYGTGGTLDNVGSLCALTSEAGTRFRRMAWEHVARINPSAVHKAQQIAKTR